MITARLLRIFVLCPYTYSSKQRALVTSAYRGKPYRAFAPCEGRGEGYVEMFPSSCDQPRRMAAVCPLAGLVCLLVLVRGGRMRLPCLGWGVVWFTEVILLRMYVQQVCLFVQNKTLPKGLR